MPRRIDDDALNYGWGHQPGWTDESELTLVGVVSGSRAAVAAVRADTMDSIAWRAEELTTLVRAASADDRLATLRWTEVPVAAGPDWRSALPAT